MGKALKVSSRKGKKAPRELEEPEGRIFNPLEHVLVPKHEKLTEKERLALMEKYKLTLIQLPKISIRDPALRGLTLKQGDIVKITRKSYTAGETVFYRGVIDE
jgi:DNA-directed RNA polymerase subunit H